MVEFSDWPPETQDMLRSVAKGLVNGDLQPLATYLRAGNHDLGKATASLLADMIEPPDNALPPYRLKLVACRPGYQGWSKSIERHDRSMQIGVFMEDRVRSFGHGGYDAALAETMAKFRLSKEAIRNHHNYLRSYLKSAGQGEQKQDWSLTPDEFWEATKRFYPTP